MGIRKFVILIIFLLTLISSMGCWNRRELDTLAIVSGAGIDIDKESGEIQITTQVIKPGEVLAPSAGGSGGSGETQGYFNITATGISDFKAIRQLTFSSSRQLFWPHSEILVLGNDVARDGVYKYIDFFVRDPEMRRTIWILVAKENAKEILEIQPTFESIPAMDISKLIEGRKATSEIAGVNLHEFMTRLLSKTTAPVATLVEVSGEGKEKSARLAGTAVFKHDKMVGVLDKAETRGLLWIIGEIGNGIIVVDCPQGNNKVSLEIFRASSKIIPEIINDKITIKVEITEEGHLGSQMCTEDLTQLPAFRSLEKLKAQAIKYEVISALSKAQELNADIFGFGDAVHRRYPKIWKELEDQWDDYFPDLEVTVAVDAKIRRVGMTTKPVIPE